MRHATPLRPLCARRGREGCRAAEAGSTVCWTATLWAAGVVLLLALAPSGTRAQLSPGPLSRAHQFLSGPIRCTSCHSFAVGTPSFKCLDCHVEIAERLAQRRGPHAKWVGEGSGNGRTCARCHSEHNGENFNLIRWQPSQKEFDHSQTGYILEGKHAALDCNQCHTPKHIADAERRKIQMKDLNRTYLGLSRACTSCHADPHRGEQGNNCRQCHTFEGWKGATRFDHSKTRFPLTGAHARVPCQKCHVPTGPQKALKFSGLKFGRCNDCHADPHRGVFPNSCDSCHTTAAWKQVQMAGKFDHSKTRFPLLGKHAGVACTACHHGGDFKRPLPHGKCSDCHTPDPHGGQFVERSDHGECSACHTVDTFKPARFGVAEHAATRYPLEGGHAKVACVKCHLPAGRATQYRIPFARCTDCHSDPHKGQFAGAPHFNRCEECHTLQGYRPSTFTIARHQSTSFPLRGAHMAVACIECHVAESHQPGAAIRFRFADLRCEGCHTDPHKGQFKQRMSQRRADGSLAGCEACHTLNSWHEVARFDHATTTFPLTGVHRTLACIKCHIPPAGKRGLREVDFQAAPTRCEGCHADVHGAQFAASGKPTDCSSCHNPFRWKPSTFDHDKRAHFPLRGAHRNVACAGCHKTTRPVNGKPVVFYKPTPRECKACHGAIEAEPASVRPTASDRRRGTAPGLLKF